MESGDAKAGGSKKMYWAGWVISVLPAPLLIMSAAMKFSAGKQVQEGFEHLGWPMSQGAGLAIVEMTCLVLYLIPKTAVLGAILLTGYMGGAIAAHVRVGDPFIVQSLLGVAAWLGLYLRDEKLRAILPLR